MDIIVGTAGHIDHGKTALVRALTGVDCDRLPEEKRRGITIDLGFANWNSGDYQIGFVDVPGHERFVKNMLAGIGGIDSVLLVVAADESVMPQTREHFAICNLLRIPAGVVAITKSDMVEEEMVEVVRAEVEDLLRGTLLQRADIIPVSTVTEAGLDDLKAALMASVTMVPDRDCIHRVYRLPIDRVFTMKGFGTVVTGTAISGVLPLDTDVEVMPDGLRSRARNIQVHGTARPQSLAGERTSINLADLPLSALHRGQLVSVPGTLQSSQILTARLELLPDSARLKDGARIRFHHFSSELLGSVRILDSAPTEIHPGSSAYVQIRLETPIAAIAGDRFIIRRYSPSRTIGGGAILDAHIGKLSRGTRKEILQSLEDLTPRARLRILARLAGPRGVTLHKLQLHLGVTSLHLLAQLDDDLSGLVRIGSGSETTWLDENAVAEVRKSAMTFVQEFFTGNALATGLKKGELIQQLFRGAVDPVVAQYLIQDLQQEQIIVVDGDNVDVPGRSKDLKGSEGELARLIEKHFRDAGLQTPAVSELIRAIPQRPKVIEGVIGFLVKKGTLVKLAEGIYLHPDVLATARAKLAEHSGRVADVAWFKELYGISRKVVIPLLEHFDREALTKRMGDQRKVL